MMIPTPLIRFQEREVMVLELPNVRTIQRQRILQQWWVLEDDSDGEWRDVPVVQEER